MQKFGVNFFTGIAALMIGVSVTGFAQTFFDSGANTDTKNTTSTDKVQKVSPEDFKSKVKALNQQTSDSLKGQVKSQFVTPTPPGPPIKLPNVPQQAAPNETSSTDNTSKAAPAAANTPAPAPSVPVTPQQPTTATNTPAPASPLPQSPTSNAAPSSSSKPYTGFGGGAAASGKNSNSSKGNSGLNINY